MNRLLALAVVLGLFAVPLMAGCQGQGEEESATEQMKEGAEGAAEETAEAAEEAAEEAEGAVE